MSDLLYFTYLRNWQWSASVLLV